MQCNLQLVATGEESQQKMDVGAFWDGALPRFVRISAALHLLQSRCVSRQHVCKFATRGAYLAAQDLAAGYELLLLPICPADLALLGTWMALLLTSSGKCQKQEIS